MWRLAGDLELKRSGVVGKDEPVTTEGRHPERSVKVWAGGVDDEGGVTEAGGDLELSRTGQTAGAQHVEFAARVDDRDGERTAWDVDSGPLDVQDVLTHLGRVVAAADCTVTRLVLRHFDAESSYTPVHTVPHHSSTTRMRCHTTSSAIADKPRDAVVTLLRYCRTFCQTRKVWLPDGEKNSKICLFVLT